MVRRHDKIKILFTLSELMYNSKTRQLIDLVSGLDKNIFQLEIAASTIGDEATEDIMGLDVPVYPLRLYPPHQQNLKRWIDFCMSSLKLKRDYDIVHSLHYYSFFYEPLIIKLFTKAKYVYSKSNLEWKSHQICWKIKSHLADRIISGSSYLTELLTEKGYGQKVETIFYGIDTEYFVPFSRSDKQGARQKAGIPTNYFVFGCAAQFIPSKNHGCLIRAFARITKTYNNCLLILCGPNYNDEYYKQVCKLLWETGLQEKVRYIGVVDDMRRFYKLIDCFVLPSTNEAFGLVYAEAMSCGIPVIGTNYGGPKDLIVDNKNGFLTRANDEAHLARVMAEYLGKPYLASLHGIHGRERAVRLFSKKMVIEKHSRLYLSLVEKDKYSV